MGMFDTIYVDRKIIDVLLEKDIADVLLTHDEGRYYSFQTKSIDNTLDSFYVDADMVLKRATWENEPDAAFWKETDREPYGFTGYVEFYDYVAVGSRSGRVVLCAHIIRGKIDGRVEIKNIELREKAELQEEARKVRDRWDGIKRTPEWFALEALMRADVWVNRHVLKPVQKLVNKAAMELQRRAERKYDKGTK